MAIENNVKRANQDTFKYKSKGKRYNQNKSQVFKFFAKF